MQGFVLALLAIVWLPGAVTWCLLRAALPLTDSATVDGRHSETWFLAERPLWASLFLWTATGLMIVGWLGLILAQLGQFMLPIIVVTLVVYTLVCLGLLAWWCQFALRSYRTKVRRLRYLCSGVVAGRIRWTKVHREQVNEHAEQYDNDRLKPQLRARSPGVEPSGGTVDADNRLKPRLQLRDGLDAIIAAVLLGGALYLYSLPAEYLPAFFDPGWYLSTGALVAETGGITFESRSFSALPPDLRSLFFSSFSTLRSDFPQLPESVSQGFFLTAFAVPDADDGTVTPYHPPLLSIWLALFYAFGGLRAALHVPILFGALSVLAMFLAGRSLFGRGPGLLAALLLAISLPQIYYSRTPYAEVLVQFLVLLGLYALTAFARGAGSPHAALAGLAFGQALLTKIEALLIVIPLAIFWVLWLVRRRSSYQAFLCFVLPFAALAGHALLLAATVNRLYVLLNGYGVWSILRAALARPPLWLALAVVAVTAMFLLLRYRQSWRGLSVGHWLAQALSPVLRRAVAWVILLLAVYGYFVQPLLGALVPGGLWSGTPSLVQLGRFLSPWGLWLGLVGLVLLVDRGFAQRQTFFAALTLTTCVIVVAAPTISTAVSPLYAVRRQVPIVIPTLLLLASYTLLSGWRLVPGFLGRSAPAARDHVATGIVSVLEKHRRTLMWLTQGLAILVLVVGLVRIARPYIRYREMRGTVAFVERLASRFPETALVLFEAVDVDSHVGRFAAPLWAIHKLDALLVSSWASPEQISRALAFWSMQDRAMYWVSASPRPPVMVSGFRFDLVDDDLWGSSAISPDPAYPPQIEWLEVPFYIYRIIPESP